MSKSEVKGKRMVSGRSVVRSRRGRFLWEKRRWLLISALFVLYPGSPVLAQSPGVVLEPVTLQLRWHHQFQFAGYYAAKAKGFYADVGLDVTIVAGSPERQPIPEVLAGRAQYGEANSEVIWARLQGEPLLALAAIYQHSPLVLLTLKSSGLTTPADLIGKRVMSVGGANDVNFRAMFNRQSIPIDAMLWQPSSFRLEDLIEGNTDAYNAYLTNEPFYLEAMGLEYNVINPRDYGVDFYSDILFTSEQEASRYPDRVRRFREASIRGWHYALTHHEEIIRLIREQYNPAKTLNHLRFEALAVHAMILPEVVEVGYISDDRLRTMANVYREQGTVKSLAALDGFVFEDDRETRNLYRMLIFSGVIIVVALVGVTLLTLLILRLRAEIAERKAAEEQLKWLADTDSMTGLLNRRAFTRRYNSELVRAQRYGDCFSVILIDLDEFKEINDVHGHDAGDRVIEAVAELLLADTRESDLCGRFGGEEFIILLPKTRLDEAAIYAGRLCHDIRNLAVKLREGVDLQVSASVGVAQWQSGDVAEATIIKADKALYNAKNAGRSRVVEWPLNLQAKVV